MDGKGTRVGIEGRYLKRGERFLEPLDENYTSCCFLKPHGRQAGKRNFVVIGLFFPLFCGHCRIIIRLYILVDNSGRNRDIAAM